VERDVQTGLGAGVEEPLAQRIFADDPRECTVGDAVVDPRPGLPVVTGPIEAGAEVVVLVHRGREVGRSLVAPRSVDRVDLDPRGDARGRDVLPGLAVVAGEV